MSIPVFPAMAFSGQARYSCDFELSDGDELTRTFSGTPTDDQIWTLAFWYKMESAQATAEQYIFYAAPDSFALNNDGSHDEAPRIQQTLSGQSETTQQLTADWTTTGQWYHVVLAVNYTLNNGNSVRIYRDGTEDDTWDTYNTPANAASAGFNTAQAHRIGGTTGSNNIDMKLAEVHFIDGQQLTPSSFYSGGKPIEYSGSYGTFGFQLLFADSGDLGNDTSGNNNDWTVYNTPVQSNDNPW